MHQINVLDCGYVRFIEDWGRGESEHPEAGIIEAARQSTQGSFRGWEEDEKLLRFLFTERPQHATPFEFAGMTIEVQAPLFVFREWHRHRTQSYNEMSARYAPLPDLNYTPTLSRVMAKPPDKNKQAAPLAGSAELTEERADAWIGALRRLYRLSEEIYQLGLEGGVPKELARLAVTVGRYSRMRASANLRNWLAFMTLRCDPAAQHEIRAFANAVAAIVSFRFPRTYALYCEGKK